MKKRKTDMERLQQARQQYESISIPAELNDRLEQTIAQHPYQPQMETMATHVAKKKRRRPYSAVAAACLLGLFGVCSLNPAIAQNMESVPVLGSITQLFTVQTWFAQDDNTTISVEQPALDGTGALTQSINHQMESIVTERTEQAQQSLEEYKEAFLATGGTEEEWLEHDLKVDISYQILSQSEQYLSFVLTSVENWNNAGVQTWYYNIDMQNDTIVTLQDLLGEDYIHIANNSILQQMQQRMEADEQVSYFEAELGGFTTIDENTSFYINAAGNPVIVFARYEIAPGAMGQQEFEIEKN